MAEHRDADLVVNIDLDTTSVDGLLAWMTRVIGLGAAEGSPTCALAVVKLAHFSDGDLRTRRLGKSGYVVTDEDDPHRF